MLSDPMQGAFLMSISRMISPKTILELGTYTGYSTICLAAGLHPEGVIHTVEPNDELNAIQDEFWDKAGIKNRIIRYNAEATPVLEHLEETFDLVWIDADKLRTPQYVESALTKTKVGGWILVDNVLWWGKVLDSQDSTDPTSEVLRTMNASLATRADIRVTLVPIRDGITVIEKLS